MSDHIPYPLEFQHIQGGEYEYRPEDLGPGRVERAGSRERATMMPEEEEEEEVEQGPPKLIEYSKLGRKSPAPPEGFGQTTASSSTTTTIPASQAAPPQSKEEGGQMKGEGQTQGGGEEGEQQEAKPE